MKVDPLNQTATRGLFECDVYGNANNSYNLDITYMQLVALKGKYPNYPLPYLYKVILP